MRTWVVAALLVAVAGCSLYGDDAPPDTETDAGVQADAPMAWAPSWSEIACINACDLDDGLSRCGEPSACQPDCERAAPVGGAWCPCPAGEQCDPIVSLCTWLCDPARALCPGAEIAACMGACVSGSEDGAGALCTGQL